MLIVAKGNPLSQVLIDRDAQDFLKVVHMVFGSGVVGPGTNDFYPLQRTKFTGGKFLL